MWAALFTRLNSLSEERYLSHGTAFLCFNAAVRTGTVSVISASAPAVSPVKPSIHRRLSRRSVKIAPPIAARSHHAVSPINTGRQVRVNTRAGRHGCCGSRLASLLSIH